MLTDKIADMLTSSIPKLPDPVPEPDLIELMPECKMHFKFITEVAHNVYPGFVDLDKLQDVLENTFINQEYLYPYEISFLRSYVSLICKNHCANGDLPFDDKGDLLNER